MKFKPFYSLAFLLPQFLYATNGTWNDTTGDWSVAGNWVGNNIANTPVPANATFPTAGTFTITVDNAPTGFTITNLAMSDGQYTFVSSTTAKLHFIDNSGASAEINGTSGSTPQTFGTVGTPLAIQLDNAASAPTAFIPPTGIEYDFVGTISGTGSLFLFPSMNSIISLNVTGTWSGQLSPTIGVLQIDSATNGKVIYANNGAFPASTTQATGVSILDGANLTMSAAMTSGNAFFLNMGNGTPSVTQSSGATVFLNGLISGGGATIALDTTGSGSLFEIQNGTTTFSGSFTGGVQNLISNDPTSGSRLNISGSANQTFGGGSGSTYFARTFIESGATATAQSPVAFGASTGGGGSPVFVRSGGTLIFDNSGGSFSMNKDIQINGTGVGGNGAIQTTSSANTGTISGTVTFGWTGGPETATAPTINTISTLAMTGTVTGSQALTKTGSGTLQFFPASGNNTFTATPQVMNGFLEGNTAGFPTNINTSASGIVQFTQTTNGTYSQVLSGNGQLFKHGAATLILSGANTIGATVISTGVLQGTTTSIQGNIINNATLDFNQSATGAFTGSINSGSGLVAIDSSVAGAVATIFSNINGYSGPTVVNNANANTPVLRMGIANSIMTSSGVTINSGGTFDLNNFNQSIQNLAGAGSVTLGTAGLTVTPSSASTTFSGSITGSGTLTKAGTNTLILSGTNGYTGTTTVNTNGGTLQMGVVNSIATSTGLTVNSGGTFALNDFSQNVQGLAGAGSVTLGTMAATALSVSTATSGSTIFSGVISGAGTLTKTGVNTLQLAGTNLYSGATTIASSGGTLQAGIANTIQSSSGLTINTGGTFDLNSFAQTIANLSGTGSITLGSATLSLNPTTAFTTFGGSITGTGGLSKLGINTFNLGAAAGYTGATTIAASGGTLQMGAINAIATSSGLTINSGGTFDLNNLAQTIQDFSGSGQVTLGTATLTVNPVSASTTFAGAISGTGGVTKTGANTLVLTGTNNYLGTTTVSAGTLNGSTTSVPGNALNNATLIFTQNSPGTYSATLTGTGAFHLQGTSTLTFGATTQTQGSTFVDTGTLILSGTTLTSPTVTVAAPATLKGAGTINGATTVSGTLSPGNSIGTITGTTFTFGAGSTYSVQVDTTLASQIIAAGAFTITPGATLQVVPISSTLNGSPYTIVTASPVTGTFSTVTITSPLFTPTVTYTTDNIFLSFAMNTPSNIIPHVPIPGNGGQVVKALLGLNPFGDPCLENLFSSFNTTNIAIFTNQVNQLQPALFNAFSLSQESVTIALREVITQRLLAQKYKCDDCYFYSGVDTWIAPFGDFLKQGSIVSMVPGFSTNSGGVALGADYQVGCNWLLGGSLAYSYSSLDIDNHGVGSGFGHTNSVYALLYSSYWQQHFFCDIALLGAYNAFNGTRHVKFSSIFASLNLKPHHSNSGFEGAAHIAFGAPIGPTGKYCDAWFTPYAMADYIFIHETDYKEHNGECIDLAVKSRNSDYLRAEEGFRFSSFKIFPCITVVPEVRIAIAEEWRFRGKKTTARFEEGDIFFTVKGIFPNRVLFVPGVAVSTYFFNNQSILNTRLDAEITRHYWDVKMQVEYSHRF